MAQKQKIFVCLTPCLWSCTWVRICIIISSAIFFIFFQNLDFWVFRGWGRGEGRGATGYSLSHSIYQELLIMSSRFLANRCKMMKSLGCFFIFSKFWFSGPKLHLCISYDSEFGYKYIKWYLQQFYSFFQNSNFLDF